MSGKAKDFTGQRFTKLVALRSTGVTNKSRNMIWELLCDCGNTRFADSGSLTKGTAKSCGCILRTQFECSMPGCTSPAVSHHLCNAHLHRRRNGLTDLSKTAKGTSYDMAERFAAKTKRSESGCLEWTGTTGDFGYGQTSYKGKKQNTHRLAWIIAHGPIEPGLSVLHKCDNPRCVDVSHLFLGTQRENVHDAIRKGRMSWQGGVK